MERETRSVDKKGELELYRRIPKRKINGFMLSKLCVRPSFFECVAIDV
jgi:hypothetical protein